MTYLYKRHDIYYFRIAVPKSLRPLIQQREIIKSLHTHYYDQARRLARLLLRQVEELFAATRSGTMNQEEIKKAIAAFIKNQENKGAFDFINYEGKLDYTYYDRFAHRATGSEYEKIPSYNYIRNAILSKMATFNTAGMEQAVEMVFGIKPDNDGYAQVCFALLAFDAEQYKSLIEMAQGDLTTFTAIRERYCEARTPPASTQQAPTNQQAHHPAPPTLPAQPTILLSEAIKRYTKRKLSEESWAKKTVYESERNFEVILFVVGDVEMIRFDDQEFVQEIVDRFKRLPKDKNKKKEFRELNIHQVLEVPDTVKISSDRVNKYLEYLATVVVFSIKGKWLTTNHMQDFRVRKKRGQKVSEKRDAYDANDISRLLEGLQKVFVRSEPEKLWMSTLMLFHGCRPADLIKITRDQFKTIDGILCMSVASKTDAGTRIFPVHPFVLKCGFERFLSSIPEGGKLWGDKLKFYELKDSDSHERWYNRTFEPNNVSKSAKKSLYSLRHSFITNLKHAEVNLFLVKSIVGHEQGLPDEDITFDRYGKDYPPKKKLGALEALDYGINLEPFRVFCQGIQW